MQTHKNPCKHRLMIISPIDKKNNINTHFQNQYKINIKHNTNYNFYINYDEKHRPAKKITKIQNKCPTANSHMCKASPYKLPGINLQCTFTQQGQQHSLKTNAILQPIAFTLKTKLANQTLPPHFRQQIATFKLYLNPKQHSTIENSVIGS